MCRGVFRSVRLSSAEILIEVVGAVESFGRLLVKDCRTGLRHHRLPSAALRIFAIARESFVEMVDWFMPSSWAISELRMPS